MPANLTLRTHPDVEAIWRSSDTVRRGYWLKLCLALGLGAVLLAGGPDRMSSPGFATLRVLGGWPLWGLLLLALAAALLVARGLGPWWVRTAYWVGAVMYAVMAVAFLVAGIGSPVTALTGPVAYSFIAAAHVSQTFAYWCFGGVCGEGHL